MPIFEFLPEGIADQFRKQFDMEMMRKEALQNEIQSLFVELSPDHLATLRFIFDQIREESHSVLSAFYSGMIAQTLILKHDRCPGCGQVHDDPLEHVVSEATGTEPTHEATGTKPVHEDSLVSIVHEYAGSGPLPSVEDGFIDFTKELIGQVGEIPQAIRSKMDEYNIDDLRDEDPPHRILGFICKNCGMKYPSVRDRMLHEPDDCSGCIQKAKWG